MRASADSTGLSVQIWCMGWPTEADRDIDSVQKWVTFTLTWIYMLTQQIWVIFLIVLYCSHLGGMKLGSPDDVPEFPTASWFMMMFSAGIGIGLFFFGVAEPIFHYEPCASSGVFAGEDGACVGAVGGNRYSRLPDDERAQWAMNLAFFHWGVHAWVTYCIIGLLLAAVVYRKCAPPCHMHAAKGHSCHRMAKSKTMRSGQRSSGRYILLLECLTVRVLNACCCAGTCP